MTGKTSRSSSSCAQFRPEVPFCTANPASLRLRSAGRVANGEDCHGAGKSRIMKPNRSPRYLAWIRTQPCCVCGATQRIEASHTGPHGIGQKSSDSSAIPLCAKHHRTGNDSYHRLGPRKFAERHKLDIPAIVRRLSLKPTIRIECGWFVSYISGQRYALSRTDAGIRRACARRFSFGGRAPRPRRSRHEDRQMPADHPCFL